MHPGLGDTMYEDGQYQGAKDDIEIDFSEIIRHKDFLMKLIQNAPSIIIGTDLKGKIMLFNKEAEKITGYNEDEAVGKNFIQLMVTEEEKMDTAGIFALSTQIGTFYNIERHLIGEEDDTHLINWCIGPVLDEGDNRIGIIFLGSDVSEKEVIESLGELADLAPETQAAPPQPSEIGIQVEDASLFEEAIQAEKEWENAFNSISDPIIIISKENQILRINSAYANMVNSAAEDLVGKKCCEVFHDAESPIHKCLHKKINETQSEFSEEIKDPESGSTTMVSCFPYHDDLGEFLGSIMVAKDVTSKVLSKTECAKPKKIKDLDLLISAISHEINNPLGGLLNYAEAISEEEDPVKIRFYSKEIRDGAARVSNMLSSLSQYSKGHSKPGMEPIELNSIIESSLNFLKNNGRLGKCQVKTDFTTVPKINGFPSEITQVMAYLLINSKEAIGDVGKIQITTKAESGNVQVVFQDEGKETPKANIAWMFDPSFEPKQEGTGDINKRIEIGLRMNAITAILKKHNSALEIITKEEGGRTFVMNFRSAEEESN
jgi:PAS domain S-box-containing protein